MRKESLPAGVGIDKCAPVPRVAPDDSVKVGANFVPKDGKWEVTGSFVSKPGEDSTVHKANFEESLGWYSAITADIFAKSAAPAAAKKRA